jgi:hypothetical protein
VHPDPRINGFLQPRRSRLNQGHTEGVRNTRWWAVLAAVAFGIAVVLLFAPTGTSETCTATSGEPPVCTQASTSMLSHEGLWVLLPLALPAIACLVPVRLRGNLAAWLTAVALLVFCLLTGFTIGLYFMPVALIALVLALRGTAAPGQRSRVPRTRLRYIKIDRPRTVPSIS